MFLTMRKKDLLHVLKGVELLTRAVVACETERVVRLSDLAAATGAIADATTSQADALALREVAARAKAEGRLDRDLRAIVAAAESAKESPNASRHELRSALQKSLDHVYAALV